MKVANPYADLRALLDATRQLTPEEMAELHLEQGYVDRALRIYDELTRREPGNASYATRRAWLARMASVRSVRAIGPRERETEPEARPRRATLSGIGPLADVEREEEPSVVRALRIVRVR